MTPGYIILKFKRVNQFSYLASLVTSDGSDKGIKRRITMAKDTFSKQTVESQDQRANKNQRV